MEHLDISTVILVHVDPRTFSCRVQVVDCTPTLDLQGARMFASAFYYKRNSIVLIGGYADWSGKLSNKGAFIDCDTESLETVECPIDCAEGFLVETVSGIQKIYLFLLMYKVLINLANHNV